MDVRLVVWGIFGGIGFAFFFMLIELLRRFSSRENTTIPHSISSDIAAAAAAATTTTTQQQIPIFNLPVLRDFSYQQLHQASNGFAQENLLKEGHMGKLYGASLGKEGQVVIKCVESESQSSSDLVFESEVEMVAALSHHRRFVQIVGICRERKMLVFKQMGNGDLASALRRGDELKSSDGESESSSDSSTGSAKPLDWITRFKIAIGVAEALVHLHHECSPAIIHRDLKSSSVLLDEGYEVRLGSFGKACIQQQGNVFPVFDIYCYGKILLDLISGLDISGSCDGFAEAWLHKALPLIDFSKQEAFLRLVDPTLVLDEDHVKELMLLALIAKSCLDPDQAQHQSMSNILHMLQNPAFFLALAGQ